MPDSICHTWVDSDNNDEITYRATWLNEIIFYHAQTSVQKATTMRFSSPSLLGLSVCNSDFIKAGEILKEGTAKQVLFDLKSICEFDGGSCVPEVVSEARVASWEDYVGGTNSLMNGKSYGFDKYGHRDFIGIMSDPQHPGGGGVKERLITTSCTKPSPRPLR